MINLTKQRNYTTNTEYMALRKHLSTALLLLALLPGCSDSDTTSSSPSKGDPITRTHNEHLPIPPPMKTAPPPYPWEKDMVANLPKITKEFFRCKGSPLNPERIQEQNGKILRIADCGGSEKHSLPLNNQREFIYPILIDLMNYIQRQTGKKVVITSGHRCPEHNAYVDSSTPNTYSKHLIAAETSFYVQGLEYEPQHIVNILLDYYRDNPKYQNQYAFQLFHRYEKSDTNVSIQPWFNKEIFIKLFQKEEGRNFDNRHPFPYISIQVRYDTDLNERVTYSWDRAQKNYLRR
ncbi:MAG: hypothetical protein K940chlam7_02065 [Chlamydiae bacterium]|nr:hypothetical protein [Chlamydiota bacterium]